MTLIAEQTARSRDIERKRILHLIETEKWRGKKQLLEILNGANSRPSPENR